MGMARLVKATLGWLVFCRMFRGGSRRGRCCTRAVVTSSGSRRVEIPASSPAILRMC